MEKFSTLNFATLKCSIVHELQQLHLKFSQGFGFLKHAESFS